MSGGLNRLEGRRAVITGAAAGIGRELARGLSARGCHLALVDTDEPGLAKLHEELRTGEGAGHVSTHRADVSDRGRMSELPAEIAVEHPELHLLINNAGIGYEAPFPQTRLETWDRVLGVNLWGVIHGCHFFMPMLARAERAHIVNLSSLFGIAGMPGQTAYCASKYAVRGLSECLWEELRETSIGLTVVHPGSVATDIMRSSEGDDEELMARLVEWYDANAYSPTLAAEQIIRAIQTGQPRLLISWEATVVDLVKRAMPVRGNRAIVELVLRVLGLGHMRERRREQWRATMLDGEP